LPPGALGDVQLASVERDVDAVLAVASGSERLPDVLLRLPLTDTTLVGRVEDRFAGRRIERLISKLSPKHELGAWLRHLAYCAACPDAGETTVVARGDGSGEAEVLTFERVEDAEKRLAELVSLRALGLRMPLPLFMKASHAYARALLKHGDELGALEVAARELNSQGAMKLSEAEDRCVRQLWSRAHLERVGELSASDGDRTLRFGELAELVFVPMLQHQAKPEAS
jgi:exonuclease V gamma subunit